MHCTMYNLVQFVQKKSNNKKTLKMIKICHFDMMNINGLNLYIFREQT